MIHAIASRFATDNGRKIADSILSNPSAWVPQRGGYRIVNKADELAIWIANSRYGVTVEYGSGPAAREYRPSWADQTLIWHAVKKLNVPKPWQWERIYLAEHLGKAD